MEPFEQRARAWSEDQCGSPVRAFDPLPGGAGRRRYWRICLEDGGRRVLMEAHSEDPAILPPALREPSVSRPFVAVTELLDAHGLPVPTLYALEPVENWLLLEDLGEIHLLDLTGPERACREKEALELLARVHAIDSTAGSFPFDRRFDREWIEFELGLFLESVPDPALRGELSREFAGLAAAIEALPSCLCLRDYQSQNLMVDPSGRLRMIDYQDALLAPRELDLAAMIYDSYVERSESDRRALLDFYASAAGCRLDPGALAMLVVQRKCKDFSRFASLVQAKGDLRYAPFVAAARETVLGMLPALPRELGRLGPLLEEALGGGPK